MKLTSPPIPPSADDLSGDAVAWRNRARQDFPYFCRTVLKIRPKKDLLNEEESSGPLMPFVFNEVQVAVYAAMLEMIQMKVPIRLVICKARQFGVSTLFCAWIFWNMWRATHVQTAIVAHSKRTLHALMETMSRFYESFPDGFRPELRQRGKKMRVGKEDMYFADRKSSNIIVPASKDALRGPDYDLVLTTEVSSYAEPEEFYGGFIPTMTEKWYSTLVLESSPKDGFFRNEYEKAKERLGGFRALFFAWWILPTLYSLPLKKVGRGLFDPKTEERVRFDDDERQEQKQLSAMARKIGRPPITDEQMYWRQRRIHQPGYDVELFNQEYPRDDVSAFELATRSAFKIVMPLVRKEVEEAEEVCPEFTMGSIESPNYDPIKTRDFDYGNVTVNVVEEPYEGYIDQDRRAGLMMLRPPEEGFVYTIGADVADDSGVMGEDEEDDDSAYSAACVYCCNRREQVAEWHGRIDPHDYGDVLAMLGYLYNTSMIAVERNNMGISTEDRLLTYLKYPLWFRWPDFGTGGGKLTKKAMWETTTRTKQIMIGGLKVAVRDGLFIVRSPHLYHEMSGYVVKNGKFKPSAGYYADRIIAAALAWQCVEQTEFGYGRIVLGSAVNDAPKAQAGARRVTAYRSRAAILQPPSRLPDEFGGDTLRVEEDRSSFESMVPEELLVG